MTVALIVVGYVLGIAAAFVFHLRALAHSTRRIMGHYAVPGEELDAADIAAAGFFALYWPISLPLMAFMEYGNGVARSRFIRRLIGRDGAA